MTVNDELAEEIVQRQSLLMAHRRTLMHLLRQAAIFGPFTPSHVAHGIDEARAAIAQVKSELRAEGVPVDDLAGDLPGTTSAERRVRRLRLLTPVAVAIVLLIAVLELSGGLAGIQERLDVWGLRPAIQPEQPGETLLVITKFYYTEGNRNTEAHQEIARAVRAAAQEAGLTKLRVEIAPTALRADNRDGAEQIGARYNASLMIWGDDTGVRVTVNFLNRRGTPDIDAKDVTINELGRTQIANPPAYAQFVTDDLPRQLAFLALFAVGQSSFLSNNNNTAVHVFERAIKLMPPTSRLEGLDTAYYTLGWLYQISEHDPVQVVAMYDQAIILNPQRAMAYNNRGVARGRQGDLIAAIHDFDQSIALDSKYSGSYSNRGLARFKQGDLNGAIRDYNQAIALDPNDDTTYNNRGGAYVDQGDLASGIRDFDQAIALKPGDAWAYYNRGLARYKQGDLGDAIQDFDQAITLSPKQAEIYSARAEARANQGNWAGAIQDYDQVIALNPNQAEVYNNRGAAYYKLGDMTKSIRDYNQAIALDPNNIQSYFNRGLAYIGQGDLAKAVQDFNQVIAFNPNDAEAYYSRGIAYQRQGDYAIAIADMEQVLHLTDNAKLRGMAEEKLRELRAQ